MLKFLAYHMGNALLQTVAMLANRFAESILPLPTAFAISRKLQKVTRLSRRTDRENRAPTGEPRRGNGHFAQQALQLAHSPRQGLECVDQQEPESKHEPQGE